MNLREAIENDNENLDIILINQISSINTPDANGTTALHLAAKKGKVHIVNTLLSKGADINAKDKFGRIPLHLAVEHAREESIISLLDRDLITRGISVNSVDKEGLSPLHKAAQQGCPKFVNMFLGRGADINIVDNKGETPLHLAAARGHINITNILIVKGASVNVANKEGKTPLHMAAFEGEDEVVVTLVSLGVNVNATDDAGKTPIQCARARTAEALGYPIHFAAKRCGVKTVHRLVQRGYDVNSLLENKTPLEIAIGNDKSEIAIYLLPLTSNNFDILSSYDLSRYYNSTFKYLEQQSQLALSKKTWSEISFDSTNRLSGGENYINNISAARETNSRIKECAKALFGMLCTDRAKIFWKIKMLRISSDFKDLYIKIIYLLRKASPEATLKVFEFLGVLSSTIPRLIITPEELESIAVIGPKESRDSETKEISISDSFKAISLGDKNIRDDEYSKISYSLAG